MSDTNTVAVEEIEDILDAERDALISGDLDSIDSFAARKADLLAEISEQHTALAPEIYKRLSEKALHNQNLLFGAARGIAAVRQRLLDIQNVHCGAGSYDRKGQRPPNHRPKSLEKRA
ncbi:MAG: hypothetical protein AAGF94_09910 [Pseudomonadota bacterium]